MDRVFNVTDGFILYIKDIPGELLQNSHLKIGRGFMNPNPLPDFMEVF